MSQKLVEDVGNWGKWWNEHVNDTSDLPTRVAFLQRAVMGLWECMQTALEDIHGLEGRPPESLGRRLYVPNGLTMRGDVRRFG